MNYLILIKFIIKRYKYSIEIENTCVATFNHHNEACRKIFFSDDGKTMLSCGSDRRFNVVDVKKASVKFSIKDAHKSPINSLIVIDDDRVATGDDEGVVRIWDVRQKKAIQSYKEHGDYISCFAFAPESGMLYSAGADGCISVVDMKKSKPTGVGVTEGVNDDLVGIATMSNGDFIYAAGSSGTIYEFQSHKLYQPNRCISTLTSNISVMKLVKEGYLTYASDDGVIFGLNTKNTKRQHRLTDQTNEPIFDLSISRDAKYLASCSLENIRFYNAIGLFDLNLVDVVDVKEKEKDVKKLKKQEKKIEEKLLNPEAKTVLEEAESNKKKRKKAGGVQSSTKKTKVMNQARKQFLHDLLVDY